MAQNTELQERYAKMVLAKLRKDSIFQGLANKRYEGTATAGAVKVPVRQEVAVNAYDIDNGTTLTRGTTTYKTLVIDNDRAVNELIDGYVAAAVPDNLVAERLDSAGYSMAKSTDDDIVNMFFKKTGSDYDNITVLSSTTALTKADAYDAIVDAVQKAKKLGLNVNEMWLAVTNDFYATLLKTPEFIKASDLGDAVVQSGVVGRIAGVNVYETNNIPDSAKCEFILGNNVYFHYIGEFKVAISINDLKDGVHIGASAIQGRYVDGFGVTDKNTILVKFHA